MKKTLLAAALLSCGLPFASQATIVELQTSEGNIEINLFDEQTPNTVANFLQYVNAGRYQSSVIHRSVPGFVVQGGGYTFIDSLAPIETYPTVVNEPVYSNVRGTIAMAKQAGNKDSATSQWFFNLDDNSANLDLQNGGFTVFGQVSEASLSVLDKIAALSRCGDVPVLNYSTEQCQQSVPLAAENLVTVFDAYVLDDDPASAGALDPVKNTLLQQDNSSDGNNGSTGSSSGGSLFYALAVMLSGLGLRLRRCNPLRNQ